MTQNELFILFCVFFRRPNPIPILAPPDHKKSQGSSAGDDSEKNADNDKGAENIDHILDNMFVQRQPFEPSISSLKDAPSAVGGDEKSEDQLNDGMNVSSEKLRERI